MSIVDNVVQYTLSLRDLLSGKLHEADGAAKSLEGTLGGVKSILGAVGVGLAAFEGLEFVKGSLEKYEELEKANAQLQAGLESTGHAAGISFEELEEAQNNFRTKIDYSKSAIADMQSQLLTFPAVSKSVFNDASLAIADMATRLHHGLDETAIQVGKALQDPIKGVTALRRVGVNFNETQTELIKNMVNTGHSAQAQAYILKELRTEFAGSAEAAANANPAMFHFHQSIERLHLTVGELASKLQQKLLPIVGKVVDFFMGSIHWMKEHKDLLEGIAYVVGGAAAAYLAYGAVLNGLTAITTIATAAQWLWNAALTANPIGVIIVAIGAAAGAVIYCYKHFAKFRAVLFGVWATIKEFGSIVGDIFMGLWHIIHGVFTFSLSEIKQGWSQEVNAIGDAGKRMGEAYKKGFDEGIADFNKDQAAEAAANAPHTVVKKAIGATGPAGQDAKKETAKATGNKSVVVNIKIDSLIKDFQVQTKNIVEGAHKVKEIVTQTLLSAVNDSQLVAGE